MNIHLSSRQREQCGKCPQLRSGQQGGGPMCMEAIRRTEGQAPRGDIPANCPNGFPVRRDSVSHSKSS